MRSDRPLAVEQLRALYRAVHRQLAPIQTREVLMAAAGRKVSRLGSPPHQIDRLEEILRSFGVSVCRSEQRYLSRPDIGKGGWSNAFTEVLPASLGRGDWLLYVSANERDGRSARDAEASGNDGQFGESLGIPACCTEFFLSHQEAARKKQYDFVPLVVDNTPGPFPFNPWTNFVAQYFCYSLLSFFPCSFKCERAADVARTTHAFLSQVSARFASDFLRAQRQSIVYTEYRGLFQLVGSRYRDGILSYSASRVCSTMRDAALARSLLAGDCVRVVGKHEADILDTRGLVKKMKGDNVSLCIF